MMFNSTTDYAIRILLYLAAVNRTATQQEIVEATSVSPTHIILVAERLQRDGYIHSLQGSEPNYIIRCNPTETTLYDIVWTMEDGIQVCGCDSCDPHCILSNMSPCPFTDSTIVHSLVEGALKSMTITDLVANK